MRYNIIYKFTFVFSLLWISLTVTAQTDEPLVAGINYGMSVQETITDRAFFDWWQLEVEVGDTIVVSMEAAEGLQPLLGLLNTGGDLLTRSDLETVAEVDGIAFLQHTAVTAGEYTIIASRDGRDQGTTTGTYLLTVTNRANAENAQPNPFLETEFRCGEWLLTNALTFEFTEDVILPETIIPGQVTETYRIFAYGLDGFEPVIRIQADILRDRPLDCTDSERATEGSLFDLPAFDEAHEITIEDANHVALVTINNSGDGEPLGDITITIGAKDGTSGRFVVLLEGLEIYERTDDDSFLIRRGAFAKDSTLDVYMIGSPTNRLDPFLQTIDDPTDTYLICDDFGRDDCIESPADFTASQIVIGEDGSTYTGDRFDAGLRIDSPNNTPMNMVFSSREGATTGEYVVVFVGELPAR